MMKKEFELPEISIYSFLASDIITTSPESGGQGENEDVNGDSDMKV